MNFWEGWSKPWTKEQCRDYYIRSPEYRSDVALAKLSGVSRGNILRWKKAAASGEHNWDLAQSQFRSELREAVHDKTIDALSDKLAVLEVTHAESYATLRQCAMAKANALKTRIEMVAEQAKLLPGIAIESLGADAVQADRQAQAQAQGEAIRDSDVLDLQALTNVVDKCIRGERMVLGAEYEDLNKAVAAIVRAGLEVKVPDDRVVAQYRTGQGKVA
jgi:hypothetical protein